MNRNITRETRCGWSRRRFFDRHTPTGIPCSCASCAQTWDVGRSYIRDIDELGASRRPGTCHRSDDRAGVPAGITNFSTRCASPPAPASGECSPSNAAAEAVPERFERGQPVRPSIAGSGTEFVRAQQDEAGGMNAGSARPFERGGFSTNHHLRTNAKGDPLTFDITGGEAHEVKAIIADGASLRSSRQARRRLRRR